VNETLELRDALADSPDPLTLQAVILNARYPDRFTPADGEALSAARDRDSDTGSRAAIEVALAEYRRATLQQQQEHRLRAAFGERLLVLPYLFEPSIGIPQLESLAEVLTA